MELTGKISQILPLAQGQGKNGTWKKQEYILETPGQYPKKVCVTVWGDRVDDFALQQGEEVTFSIDVESREYNGRWYTDVKAWKVEKSGAGQSSDMPPANDQSGVHPEFDILEDESGDDDLPF